MKYFKIPLNSDLSQTSYRAMTSTETNDYIEYNEGFVGEDWKEITEETLIEVFGENPFVVEPPEPEPTEPTQLDRIESVVNSIAENGTSYDEMAAAIAEGVNDV